MYRKIFTLRSQYSILQQWFNLPQSLTTIIILNKIILCPLDSFLHILHIQVLWKIMNFSMYLRRRQSGGYKMKINVLACIFSSANANCKRQLLSFLYLSYWFHSTSVPCLKSLYTTGWAHTLSKKADSGWKISREFFLCRKMLLRWIVTLELWRTTKSTQIYTNHVSFL